MAGYGDQIRTQRFGGEGDFQEALHRIGVEHGIGAELVGQLGHFFDGHHGAYLVVDHHNGYQDGVLAQRRFQALERNIAQGIGLKIGDFIALVLQLLHAV